jgi:capping protein (actin filament) muscle Z-line, beta
MFFFHHHSIHVACFLKIAVEGSEFVKQGCWDSIHIVEALDGETAGKTTYKLTTTVMLHMEVEKPEVGNTSLSGSLTRQVKHVLDL